MNEGSIIIPWEDLSGLEVGDKVEIPAEVVAEYDLGVGKVLDFRWVTFQADRKTKTFDFEGVIMDNVLKVLLGERKR